MAPKPNEIVQRELDIVSEAGIKDHHSRDLSMVISGGGCDEKR